MYQMYVDVYLCQVIHILTQSGGDLRNIWSRKGISNLMDLHSEVNLKENSQTHFFNGQAQK